MEPPIQLTWLERAIQTNKYHVIKLKEAIEEKKKWGIRNTAIALRRSYGSVAEDIKIVSWLKTHRPQIEKFHTIADALTFIRENERKRMLDDVE